MVQCTASMVDAILLEGFKFFRSELKGIVSNNLLSEAATCKQNPKSHDGLCSYHCGHLKYFLPYRVGKLILIPRFSINMRS